MSLTTLIKDRTAIAGIGMSPYGKGIEVSEEHLAGIAIGRALDDAGIDAKEVDGLVSYDMEVTSLGEMASNMGFGDLRFVAHTAGGGGGSCAGVGLGAMAIVTGQADVVVSWRSRKRSSKESRWWMNQPSVVGDRQMWLRPHGVVRTADELAFMARRHMHEFGTTQDHFANVALAFRRHANLNPTAVMHGKTLTRESYHTSRWIAEPLHLYDCCLETDGACALVLVSAERARDLKQRPVYVHAAAQGIARDNAVMVQWYAGDMMRTQAVACAAGLWKHSDIRQKDIKVAEMYDAYTPEILFTLEGYGFCGRGESGPFTDGGNIELGGRLPINTNGGSLSDAYLHGFNLVVEGVRQMRGTSTAQVQDADTCFVSGSDLVPTSAMVLRK